jgi:hypothetical protein
MNIHISLLIYNPIEAYTIILLCGIIRGSDIKIGRYKILKLFIFGTITFLFQYIPYFWYGKIIFLILNIVITYFVLPVVIKIIFLIIFKENVALRQVLVCVFIMGVFSIITSTIFGIIFKNDILFYNNSILQLNFSILLLQIILYNFIRIKKDRYEKLCKGYCKRS